MAGGIAFAAGLIGVAVSVVAGCDRSAQSDTVSSAAEMAAPRTTPGTDVGFTTDSVVADPAALDELAAGLLAAADVGVPDTWFLLDFDPAIVDDPVIAPDLDPFRGLVTCPPSTIRNGEAPWISRRFSSGGEPLDNGMVALETVLQLAPAAPAPGLDECSAPGGESSTVVTGTLATAPDGPGADAVTFVERTFATTPSDSVPFDMAFTALTASAEGFAVTIVVSGFPPATGWSEVAQTVASDVLSRLLAS